MEETYVYDKGKYHFESVDGFGLPEEHAGVHTAFFLGWLVERGLMSEEFLDDCGDMITPYLQQETTALEIYGQWDQCLISDMLSDLGNAFARAYFDFEGGDYLKDYGELLVGDLPSEYHVSYTWAHQRIMSERIEQRFQEWCQQTGRDLPENTSATE